MVNLDYSADVARSGGHTLLFLVWMYGEGPPDVHSANHTTDVHGTTECTLLFEIPLV
jgi:hypothetical protein